MVHGALLGDSVHYALGYFNGDGRDANRRSQKDDKEVTGRIVVQPFRHWGARLLRGLYVGGSGSYSRLDTSDFNYKMRTPARTTFFTVQARAKFHMTREVDTLERYAAELAYTWGPLLVTGEYFRNRFSDVKLADTTVFDFDMRAWYAGLLVMLTGERPVMKGGVLQKIRPRHCFNIRKRTWGAFGIGFRFQEFEAGRVVYRSLVQEGFSVREAEAFTVALNWYLNDMMRFSFNYSRTHFKDPLYLGTHWKGYSYYEDTEHAWTTRFQLEF
jgi:phosphate-selective porin OprO/OprP